MSSTVDDVTSVYASVALMKEEAMGFFNSVACLSGGAKRRIWN
jgi:hypothetical protein